MSRGIDDYFAARIAEEELLAASSTHPDVKVTHAAFAAAYRAHAGPKVDTVAASTTAEARLHVD